MQNNNSSISQDLNRIFDLKGESTNFVSDIIVPVVNVSPVINNIKNAGATNATSATVYTTPTDKDFYLTNATISVIKDVTSTSAGSTVRVFVNGVQSIILDLAGITLTPQTLSQTMSFVPPIKLDRGSVVVVTNGTNVANIKTDCSILGYTVETTK